MAEQRMTIKIEPSPALEQMLERVANRAAGKAQSGEAAALKAEIGLVAVRLAGVSTNGIGIDRAERLTEILGALQRLAK
jgi:hypothetical protein